MTKIFLIRHAESLANAAGIYQGQTYDTDLSPLGRHQARALSDRFRAQNFDRVISSPLRRAVQTASGLGRVETDTGLLETNHGAWEGLSKSEISARWPDLYHCWLTCPAEVVFPGGEAFTETATRAMPWFWQIPRRSGSFAVITHINFIQSIIVNRLNSDLNRTLDYPLQPTGVSLFTAHSPVRIEYLNDFSHLKSIKSDLSTHAL